MGTDINMYVEYKSTTGWHVVNDTSYSSERYKWDPAHGPEIVYYDRNYDLYGLLTGRPHGMLGAEDFAASFGIRGLPADVSPEVRAQYETLEDAISDSSWLLLSEVLAMPWNRRTKHPITGGETTFAFLAGPEFMDGVVERFNRLYDDASATRLVFWFMP
jgi:hypothetical protein